SDGRAAVRKTDSCSLVPVTQQKNSRGTSTFNASHSTRTCRLSTSNSTCGNFPIFPSASRFPLENQTEAINAATKIGRFIANLRGNKSIPSGGSLREGVQKMRGRSRRGNPRNGFPRSGVTLQNQPADG